MKNFLIVAFFTLITINIGYSQTPLDPPSITSQNAMLLATYDSTRMINFNDTSIFAPEVKSFMLGHQWYNAIAGINTRLHMNTYTNDESNIAAPIDTTGKPTFGFTFERYPRVAGKTLYLNYQGSSLTVHALSLQFDPEAPTINSDGFFTPVSGDTLGAIYGFKEKRGGKRGTAPIENRYIYRTDSVPTADSSTGIVVLSSPIGGELMHRLYGFQDKPQVPARNGRRWYLAINLRRSDTTWDNITGANDTVLTIKLPYIYRVKVGLIVDTLSSYIHFDSITALNNTLGLDTANYARGGWMNTKLVHKGGNDTMFAIRRFMLPKFGTNCDITLSAFFKTKDSTIDTTTLNLPFREGNAQAIFNEIDTLGMDIRYYPKCNIAIDWIRLETPEARSLFRGEQDAAIALNLSHCIDVVKRCRDSVDTSGTYVGVSRLRIHRFYGSDEPSALHMRSMRYASLLVNKYFTTEGGVGNRYEALVPQNSYWGSVPRYMATGNLVPWAKYRTYGGAFEKERYHLGLGGGYENSNAIPSPDPYLNYRLNSCDGNNDGSAYEKYSYIGDGDYRSALCSGGLDLRWIATVKGIKDTVIKGASTIIVNDSIRKAQILATPGLLGGWEKVMEGWKTNPSTLFSPKPWYSNTWVISEWYQYHVTRDTNLRYMTAGGSRANTGEELRLNLWTAITLGAKGLMYDRFDYASDYDYDADKKTLFMGPTGGYSGLDSALLKKDTLGDFFMQSDAVGSDFLHQGEELAFDKYINFDSTGKALGIDSNRIYVGRKSIRLEVMKVHDKIQDIGDTLMNLQLMGWYGKGHFVSRLMRNDDTTYFSKYLRLDSGYLKTKSCIRNVVEGWDSTFCDVMIHKDVHKSMDSIFYIGVVNRRTNPLLRFSDTSDFQFYTTAEFDSLTLGSDTVWQARRYKQGGSREISIPLNYKFPNGYALLHIKQLGGGIDTIIGQDRSFVTNFLPGEGKLFSVTILPPDTTLTGVLSYTNQRKLVGFPIRRADGTESDSMYYHLTYHRYDSSTSRNKVYYRRSNKVWVNSSSENIKWQSEIPLSSKVALPRCVTDTIMSLNSTYPSLVVRYDSTVSVNKVYIVYSCTTPTLSDPCYSMFYGLNNRKIIVENILRAEDSIQTADTAKRLAIFNGTMGVYGTPMINASDSGNFYCWSDSITGITAGWKRPNVRTLSTVETIGAALFVDPDNHNPATQPSKHPSVNSYSRLRLKENDCALVWEQHLYDSAAVLNSHIFYTRLHVINDTLHHFLPPYLPVPNGIVYADTNNTVAKLNGGETTYADPTLPSVYRELTDSISPDSGTMMIQRNYIFDCAVWNAFEMTGSPGYPLGSIYRRVLWIKDTNGLADKWGSDGLTRITNGSLNYLLDASISQGNSYIGTVPTPITNESDSSVVITFSEVSAVSILGVPPTYRLWQLQSSMFFDAINADSTLYLQDNLIASKTKIIDNYALYGQTAALPRVEKQSDWRRNRRVYQRQTDPVTYGIQTSPRYFLKQSEQPNPLIFNGFSNGESKYILENPVLNYRILNLRRVKKTTEDDTEEQLEFTDTLTTGWFTVGDAAEFSFRTIGANSDLVTSYVERRSDGELFPVELRASDDTTALKTEIELEQGGDEEYRFFVVKSSDNSTILPHYRNEIMLDEIETITGFEKGSGRQIVFLGKEKGGSAVSVYPNPARDEVNLTIKGTDKSEVIIVSALGGEAVRFFAEGGKTVKVNTSTFPSGMYVVRVRRGTASDIVVPFVVFR